MRTEDSILQAPTLGSWDRIPLKERMYVQDFLCCVVLAHSLCDNCHGRISPTVCPSSGRRQTQSPKRPQCYLILCSNTGPTKRRKSFGELTRRNWKYCSGMICLKKDKHDVCDVTVPHNGAECSAPYNLRDTAAVVFLAPAARSTILLCPQ